MDGIPWTKTESPRILIKTFASCFEIYGLGVSQFLLAANRLSKNPIEADWHHDEPDQKNYACIFGAVAKRETENRNNDQHCCHDETTRTEHHTPPPNSDQNIPRNLVADSLRVR
jgi:hypothetical protein